MNMTSVKPEAPRLPALYKNAPLILVLILIGAVAFGHEGTRRWQMLALGLPALLWLFWPLQRRGLIFFRSWLAGLTLGAFVVDALMRAFLWQHYQAAPDSSLVMSSAANTNTREAFEYLSSIGPGLLLWLLPLLLPVVLLPAFLRRHVLFSLTAAPHRLPRLWRWLILGLICLCMVGYLSKPWRRHHPFLFWPNWSMELVDLRHSWSDQESQRKQLRTNAHAAQPKLISSGPSVVVLVLTESVNRDNLSLYGYRRKTTPLLETEQSNLGPNFLRLRYAWSVEANTVASLSGIFSFGERTLNSSVDKTQHLIALAQQAGYKVWWMSNHDDIAVEQQHARLADRVEIINRRPGRGGNTLDSDLLPYLKTALEDGGSERKFIVMHMLGAHPHYSLRYPKDQNNTPIFQPNDDVNLQMMAQGRPNWLRELRQEYDSALLYHDSVVTETLQLTRRFTPSGGHAAWMLMSDHGQEVGHSINHAGHSPATEAGYKIPVLFWRDSTTFNKAHGEELRPFRADWAAWTLADLLGLTWEAKNQKRNVLDATYTWEPPSLGAVTPTSFDH